MSSYRCHSMPLRAAASIMTLTSPQLFLIASSTTAFYTTVAAAATTAVSPALSVGIAKMKLGFVPLNRLSPAKRRMSYGFVFENPRIQGLGFNHKNNRQNTHAHSTVSFAHLLDDQIHTQTLDWFERIVVGWNLCPFADRPNREGNMKIAIVRGSNEHEIIAFVLGECITRQERPGTTLVVAPECHPGDFEGYLSYCTTLQDDVLPAHGLDQDIQIAPFHPLFLFADSDGVDVWTNRSPFPIFHILREEEVSMAVDKLDGDASKIWKRNIEFFKDLDNSLGGDVELQTVMRNPNHPYGEVVNRVLQNHRNKPK